METPEILIIDDDRLILDLAASALEWAFTVLKAASVEEAYEIFSKKKPACILCDIVLPGMSGIEFLETLRNGGHDIPFIIMTGNGSETYAEQCANFKTSGYIKKPFDPDALLGAVNRALGKGDGRRALPPLSKEKVHPKIREVRGWIKQNLSKRLTAREAARAVEISASHLARLYRSRTGLSFSDDVNRLRVEHAKALLKTTDLPVDVIRERVGFETPQYFFRQFKKYSGLTPRQYRLF